MTTHINGIVQTTRRMLALESEMREFADRDERRAVEDRWQQESDLRRAQVLAALKDNVDADLLTWAIDMQTPENRALVDDWVDDWARRNR